MISLAQLFLEALSELNYSKINMKPPDAVKAACRRGLSLKSKHGGSGLTAAAQLWAKKIAAGHPVTPEKLRKMRAFFARHKVDKRPGWDNPPTAGYVAWQLWGGDAGKSWAEKIVKQLDKADDDLNEALPKWKKKGWVGPSGAAKTAERQAAKQGKKNNKAYRSAIYAKMTGKK